MLRSPRSSQTSLIHRLLWKLASDLQCFQVLSKTIFMHGLIMMLWELSSYSGYHTMLRNSAFDRKQANMVVYEPVFCDINSTFTEDLWLNQLSVTLLLWQHWSYLDWFVQVVTIAHIQHNYDQGHKFTLSCSYFLHSHPVTSNLNKLDHGTQTLWCFLKLHSWQN